MRMTAPRGNIPCKIWIFLNSSFPILIDYRDLKYPSKYNNRLSDHKCVIVYAKATPRVKKILYTICRRAY